MLLVFTLRQWNTFTNEYIRFFWEENILSSTVKKILKNPSLQAIKHNCLSF